MKIGILGIATESGNRGVMALGVSLCMLLKGQRNNPVVLLAGARKNTALKFYSKKGRHEVPVENFRLSFEAGCSRQLGWIILMAILYRIIPIGIIRCTIMKSVPWIKTLVECDVVGDIRGGDSFSDIYGLRRFFIGFLVAWSVLLIKGQIVQFPQTYGPFKSKLAKVMARYLLKRSPLIFARDVESQRVAQELVGKNRKVTLSPDVAFSLESILPPSVEFSPAGTIEKLNGKVVGINVNGLMFNGGYSRGNQFGLKLNYKQFLKDLISKLVENGVREVWLIPHTFAPKGDVESDNESCFKVHNSLEQSIRQYVRIVSGEYDQSEIKGIIGLCDFFVGSRMHSCIAALSQGIPCVGVAYSMKFGGVFASVGMQDWVADAKRLSSEDTINIVLQCFSQLDDIRNQLKSTSSKAQEELKEMLPLIYKMTKK